ncbi:MAG: hypothetical protein H0W61_09475 [Bacteroidetes bacterium]|nr:hypothetical protein [Bacteroidota bacterium]
MHSKPLSILLFCICCIRGLAQTDSLLYNENTNLKEGIFLSYTDFRKDDPITKEEIQSNLNKDQLDYFGKVIDQLKFTYIKNGATYSVESKNMWGFFQNRTLYVNYKEVFYRVPVVGSICYLVAVVEVPSYYPGIYGPGFGGGTGNTMKTKEIREFIINFYDGIVQELNLDNVELLLSRDQTLYKEFMALKRKKKKEQISRFIKKYNELHPVYFLK